MITPVSQKAIIFHKDKFLVLLRGSTAPSNPLKWDLPGGDMDFGEDPYESIHREIKEETGVEAKNLIPFDVESHVQKEGIFWVTIAYKATADSDKVTISWEHDEFRWVTYQQFLQLESIPKIVRFMKKAHEK